MSKDPTPLAAVILAAGRGERLQGAVGGGLKPLTPLLGITLLERALLACQAAGITDCYIAVGYQRERLQSYIATRSRRYRMRLHTVPNPHWELGNGTSAASMAPHIQSPFLLLMCDHVFDPVILTLLIAAGQNVETSLLAVDHRIDQIFDLDDATKVQLDGCNIAAIGKELQQYNAIDTGLFFCQPALFKALEHANTAGDTSLSGGIRQLIAAGTMQAMPIGDRFWMDIDTTACLTQAEDEILKQL
jgi:1L-myo-inositol 1-phosphate cytidylyltransferase